jgi:hypothetical protein
LLCALLVACAGEDPSVAQAPPLTEACANAGTDGASARCLTPTMPADHYVAQAERYFDTLDTSAAPDSMPDYALQVARWEWPPWLLLTGLGRDDMIETATLLRSVDPSTVPVRDCRAFDVQPFARCVVEFEYEKGRCPIYEEFVFNDAGEVTFIEAWSHRPALRPQSGEDPWVEREDIGRLSTRVPGLGTPSGRVALESQWMRDAAARDTDVADFSRRAVDWWSAWYDEVASAAPDYFDHGCGW